MSEFKIEAELVKDLVIPAEMEICPLRDAVVYPYMPQLLTASRKYSIRAIEAAVDKDGLIGLFAQRDPEVEDPGVDDLYRVGSIAKIHREWRMPDGSMRLIVQGLVRGSLVKFEQEHPFLKAEVLRLEDQGDVSAMDIQAMSRAVSEQFNAIVKMTSHLPDELQIMVVNIDHAGQLADFIAANLDLQRPRSDNGDNMTK